MVPVTINQCIILHGKPPVFARVSPVFPPFGPRKIAEKSPRHSAAFAPRPAPRCGAGRRKNSGRHWSPQTWCSSGANVWEPKMWRIWEESGFWMDIIWVYGWILWMGRMGNHHGFPHDDNIWVFLWIWSNRQTGAEQRPWTLGVGRLTSKKVVLPRVELIIWTVGFYRQIVGKSHADAWNLALFGSEFSVVHQRALHCTCCKDGRSKWTSQAPKKSPKRYPAWWFNSLRTWSHGPVEIVDFPIKNGDFP